jgi:hypothetical protein
MNTAIARSFMSAQKTDIEQIEAIEQRLIPSLARNVLLEEIEGESFSYVYVARLVTASGQPGAIIGYHFLVISDEIHILNIAVDPEISGLWSGDAPDAVCHQLRKERAQPVLFWKCGFLTFPRTALCKARLQAYWPEKTLLF